MGYEAHIAGLGDRPLGKRLQGSADPPDEAPLGRARSPSAAPPWWRRCARSRPVPIVNGGGTGSVHTHPPRAGHHRDHRRAPASSPPPCSTATPTSRSRPAAMFAMPVVRRPSGGVATLLGGGYHASGAAGRDRLPAPYLPRGLRLDPQEGAGEVQTPVIGAAAASLRIGDRVYLRHAKAGELCERFDRLYLVQRRRDRGRGPDLPRRGPLRALAHVPRTAQPPRIWGVSASVRRLALALPARIRPAAHGRSRHGAAERGRADDRRPDAGLARLHAADERAAGRAGHGVRADRSPPSRSAAPRGRRP